MGALGLSIQFFYYQDNCLIEKSSLEELQVCVWITTGCWVIRIAHEQPVPWLVFTKQLKYVGSLRERDLVGSVLFLF